jgi:uncharacterized protein (TIGR00369 family)
MEQIKSQEPWQFMAQNMAQIGDMMPQSKAIGARYIEITKASASAILPWQEHLLGDVENGIMASGAVVTLIDQTCGTACIAALNKPMTLATLDLRIDYMRAGRKGHDIRARAECYRVTHNIAFVRAFAYDSDNDEDIISAAQACFMINSDQPMGGMIIAKS